MRNFILIATVVFFSNACSMVKSQNSIQEDLSYKEKATALIESIETGDPEPIAYINPEKYNSTT